MTEISLKDIILSNIKVLKEKYNSNKIQNSNESIRDLSYHKRVKIGRSLESPIVTQLETIGNVKPATLSQDKLDKIDGFINFFESSKLHKMFPNEESFQIKKRTQSGNDILFEIEKDFDSSVKGRDYIGKATFYIVHNDYNIGIFEKRYIQNIANDFLKNASDELKKHQNDNYIGSVLRNNIGDLRITKGRNDGSEGFRKLILYIKFNAANPVALLPLPIL